jgi:hypothetical protein
MASNPALQELEVYLTPDGQSRAAIVRRDDGHFCIYTFWIGFNTNVPLGLLYGDVDSDDRGPFRRPEPVSTGR